MARVLFTDEKDEATGKTIPRYEHVEPGDALVKAAGAAFAEKKGIEPDSMPDTSKMTVAELRELLASLGVNVSKRVKKGELLDLVAEHYAGAADVDLDELDAVIE